MKDLWVARAFELAQRQCAVTHALTKSTQNGKPVRMGAKVVTRALTKKGAATGTAVATSQLQRDSVGLEGSNVLRRTMDCLLELARFEV